MLKLGCLSGVFKALHFTRGKATRESRHTTATCIFLSFADGFWELRKEWKSYQRVTVVSAITASATGGDGISCDRSSSTFLEKSNTHTHTHTPVSTVFLFQSVLAMELSLASNSGCSDVPALRTWGLGSQVCRTVSVMHLCVQIASFGGGENSVSKLFTEQLYTIEKLMFKIEFLYIVLRYTFS
jgi:hypothetical protein